MALWRFWRRRHTPPGTVSPPLSPGSVTIADRFGNLGSWILFSILFGLVPFIIGIVILAIFHKLSDLEGLFAHGELLIVCAVIQAEATGDLMVNKTASRVVKVPVLAFSITAFAVAVALFAVFIFSSFIITDQNIKPDDHSTAVLSYIDLSITLL